ncbi:hypothetical protein G3435_07510 [Pseudomonas sp. MAFF212428]|uniref:Uncharacterized protein n=1 Tax=Pseudomonas brassicae TaxID=2708063 RepID=A0A6B3NYX9_9PSED|nr:hypothetical protein [Pseudomonas brassicae]NER59867.1 hypothetical protein [Pseudomonas brassicae]NER64837.1 hypothetical protein [Pseudomonas brassicae]
MHMFSGVVMASTIALCLGCSREIDGSSEVQFADSTGLVGHEVAFEERVEYQQALAVVQGKYGLDRASLAKALHGKDADDIVEMAEDIREQQHEAALEQAQKAQARHLEEAKALLEQSEQRCDSLKDQRKQDDPQSPGPSIRESLACRSVEHYERLLDNLEDMSAEQYRDADKTAISSMRLR